MTYGTGAGYGNGNQNKYDIERLKNLTNSQKEGLKIIESKLNKEFLPPSNVENAIEKAYNIFVKAKIKAYGNGFAGTPIVAPDEQNKKAGELSWNDIETMLTGFAYETVCKKSKEAEKNYFTVWDYAINQGFAYGSGMGTNHHYGYQVRKIYETAWLMRDYIWKYKNGDEIISTLIFWSALQETRTPCREVRDEMLDSWNTLLKAKLVAAMIMKDDRDRVQALQGLSRWVSGSVAFSPGTIGGIKIDGTTFHHGGFYPGYTTGPLASVVKYIDLTSGTDFVPEINAEKTPCFRIRSNAELFKLIRMGDRYKRQTSVLWKNWKSRHTSLC